MATMMEAMMSMKRVMEVNTTIVIATSTTTEVDPTHPSGINQASHPVPDMVGQGAEHWEVWAAPILCRIRTSILSHHIACLPNIHHTMLHTLPMRMSITLLPYSLRANNPDLIMHMSLNPWGDT